MTLSGLFRIAAIAIPTGLTCGGALAQQIVTVAPGTVLVLVPSPTNAPGLVTTRQPMSVAETRVAELPVSIERIFAEQQAMMDRMMAGMDQLFARTAGPVDFRNGMDVAATGGPAGAFCEESISVNYTGGSRAPVVKVSRAGNGCGPAPGGASVPAAAPPPRDDQKIIQINDPAPLATPRPRHRT